MKDVYSFLIINMDNKNPWSIVSKQQVYDNAWISVDHYDVINPSGNPGIYGVVHFKLSSIGIIPVDSHGNIYLVGQWRFLLIGGVGRYRLVVEKLVRIR